MTRSTTAAALLAAAALSSPLYAQTITDLGFLPGGLQTTPAAISADGRTIVGSADHQGFAHAFKWTAATGIVDLGALPDQLSSVATAVSANGAVIIGQSGFSIVEWTQAGLETLIPWEGSTDPYAFVASGINADGSLSTGNLTCAGVSGGDPSCSVYGYAFRTDASGVHTPLVSTLPAPFYGPESFRSYGMSADGASVVGSCAAISDDTDGTRAFLWTPTSGMQNLGIVPGFQPSSVGQSHSTALAISADGSTVVGQCQGQPIIAGSFTSRAFRWTRASGIQDLGILAGSFNTVSATAVSADGSSIVGRIANFNLFNQHAILWTPARGWVDLNTYLPTVGIPLSGWSLQSAAAISDDGRVITGTGTHAGSAHAWVITLPPTCGSADFNNDGDIGTDADIESFFACLAGNCCPTCGSADFNNDGDTGTDADIEAFFRVLAGGTC